MTEYFYGETVRLGNTFTNIAGTVYDPDTVSLTIYNAEGTLEETVTYVAGDIIKSSTGVYYYDYTIPADATEQGYWIGTWTAVIGTQTDKSEEQFYARPAAEKLYVSVEEVKTSLMASGVTMADDTIRNVIRGAMAEVDQITGRRFTNGNTRTEWFNTNTPNPDTEVRQLFLTYLPVQDITTVKAYDTAKTVVKTYADTDYWIDTNGILELCTTDFQHQRRRIEVVYTYGYTSVPRKISKLCSVISQIEVMRHAMIAADDKMTSFSIPEIGEVSLGEVYVTSNITIQQLNKQKEILIKEIGNLRNDIMAI